MKNSTKSITLIFIGILLAMVAAEAVARVLYEPRSAEITGFKLTDSGFYQRDEELGWLPKKSIQGKHDKPGSFTSTFSTNSYGIRGKEISPEKQPGVQRIVILGDSFTWGYGVNDGETYPDVLQSLDVGEVVNLGVTAFGTKQETKFLQRIGLSFQPDTVLLAFVMNDIYRHPASSSPAPAPTQSKPIPQEKSVFGKTKETIAQNSAFYTLFQDVTNQYKFLVNIFVKVGLKEPPVGFEGLDDNVMPGLKKYPEQLEKSWQATQQDILDLKAVCDQNHVRFILMLVPSLQLLEREAFNQTIAYTAFDDSDFDLEKPYRMLEGFGKEHSIEVMNPIAAFERAAAEGQKFYLPKDPHFNKDGHRFLAQQIKEYLGRQQAR